MSALLPRLRLAGAAPLALLPGVVLAASEHRFPRPEFESGYAIPEIATPLPDPLVLAYLDVAILAAALTLASWLAVRKRSRRGLTLLAIASVLYFGFWRKGCICAVGALQNVALGLFDDGYAVPLTALAFFFLPLVFTLFFGRTFCAGVCPLGAIQELVVVRPLRLPRALSEALGLLPRLYLVAAILFVAAGSGFMICRYDPFVPIFRMSGSAGMLLTGGALLLLGTIIARPYCRFLCPYGVLLGWVARFARSKLTITPAECVQCRLCEDACPVDAIRDPAPLEEDGTLQVGKRRLVLLVVLLPLIVLLGAWVGAGLEGPLSLTHPTVQLAEEVFAAHDADEPSPRIEAFRRSAMPASVLYDEAAELRGRFRRGGALLGAFFALMVGLRLMGHALRRRRAGWEPDQGECHACGRCFASCPIDHVHRHGGPGAFAELLERLRRASGAHS
jgi:NosR/NirI family nitrous oxide reductase transcriptional regulator